MNAVETKKKRLPLTALLLVILGAVLMGGAGYQAYLEHRHGRALEEMRALIAGSSGSSRVQGTRVEPMERFKYIEVRDKGVDSEAFVTEPVPEDEIPRERLNEEDLESTDRFVIPLAQGDSTDLQGDGTRVAPWLGLQNALDRLRPGDRLIVSGGTYLGRYDIGGAAVDGEPDQPITVYFTSNALLQGAGKTEVCEAPVLTVARSYWQLEGISLSPQYCEEGIRVASGVTQLLLTAPHVSGGSGYGLVMEPGARGVALESIHFHQLGSLEGKDPRTRNTDKQPEDSRYAGVRGPLSGLTQLSGKIHNIFGAPVLLLDDDGEPLTHQAEAAALAKWPVHVTVNQARWW